MGRMVCVVRVVCGAGIGMRQFWKRLDPGWQFAIQLYLIARVLLTGWSLVVLLIFPTVLRNMDLFGGPVLAFFDMGTGERYAYSRQVNASTLVFRAGGNGTVVDSETASVWELDDGRAVSGAYAGRVLNASAYTAEDIFPYGGVVPDTNPLLSLWQRFDANWYLKIAEHGYSASDGSTVYLPLYPLLIRIAGAALLGQDLLAALFISNAALVGAFYLLYQIANELTDPRSAARAVAFLAIFPTAFFLFGAYTESLFLLFALASLQYGRRVNWGRAALFAMLASLTRLQGILLMVPLAYLMWQQTKKGYRPEIHALALLLIPAATAAFLAWQFLFVGNASLVGAYEGKLHARFVMPWENIAASVGLILSKNAGFVDLLNLLVTILFGAMLVYLWARKDVPREFAWYATLMYLAPIFRMTTTQPLVSMDRYALALFPVFIVWGQRASNRWANRAIVYSSFPLALYLSAQFVMWGWVG